MPVFGDDMVPPLEYRSVEEVELGADEGVAGLVGDAQRNAAYRNAEQPSVRAHEGWVLESDDAIEIRLTGIGELLKAGERAARIVEGIGIGRQPARNPSREANGEHQNLPSAALARGLRGSPSVSATRPARGKPSAAQAAMTPSSRSRENRPTCLREGRQRHIAVELETRAGALRSLRIVERQRRDDLGERPDCDRHGLLEGHPQHGALFRLDLAG